jgi:hypothetical protein
MVEENITDTNHLYVTDMINDDMCVSLGKGSFLAKWWVAGFVLVQMCIVPSPWLINDINVKAAKVNEHFQVV